LASRLFDAMLFFSFSHQHKGEQFPKTFAVLTFRYLFSYSEFKSSIAS
jgi:hypothetical protein